MKTEKIKKWFKDHKKQIIIVGSIVIGTVVAIVLVNKHGDTSALAEDDPQIPDPPDNPEEPSIDTIEEPHITIPDDFYDNLSGNRLTATELGEKLWYSAQTINKRIVEIGLAYRNALGEYEFTELGEGLGVKTYKETRYGWPFTNIEWDERILELIFTPEELESRKALIAKYKRTA